ncbi:hypothetical protein KHM83_13480, partial [Fusibacter paucivorans]
QYIYATCIVTNDYGKTSDLFHRGIDKDKEQGKVKSRGLKQYPIPHYHLNILKSKALELKQ